jgi:hypothetical protein
MDKNLSKMGLFELGQANRSHGQGAFGRALSEKAVD